MDKKALLEMTTDIVSAHANMSVMAQNDLLGEIQNVFAKLSALGGDDSVQCVEIAPAEEAEGEQPQAPAVPLEAAFGADKIFCMICGQGFKTLKRHLNTSHGLKPGQYRKQFGIPAGTPLVAKEYSERRKKMAADQDMAGRLVKARAARKKKKGK